MFNSLTSLFKQLIDGSDLSKTNALSPNMAIACLLCEVSGADHLIDEKEESTKRSLLMKLLELNEQESEQLLAQAKEKNAKRYLFVRFYFPASRTHTRDSLQLD